MVNVIMIVITAIMFCAIVMAMLWIVVLWGHPIDKNNAWYPRIIVITSFCLVCFNILLLPLDVANARLDGGFPMADMWLSIYVIIAAFCVLVVPFALFFYENEDPDSVGVRKQVISAIKYEAVTIIIVLAITLIMFFLLGTSEVPVTRLQSNLFVPGSASPASCPSCSRSSSTLDYKISFFVYFVSMMAFAGMFLFVIFGGIGLAAIPLDLINEFRFRPKPMTKDQYLTAKKKVSMRCDKLLATGDNLQHKINTAGGRPKSRRDKNAYNKFRNAVFLLEEDFIRVEESFNHGVGPKLKRFLWGWVLLGMGIIGIVLSFMWFIHIILFMIPVPPIYAYLNIGFIDMDNVFGLFGVGIYAVFAFYLLAAVIKGCFKFGMRVPFIFTIHPMKYNGTMMNAFLFNAELLLLSSVTVVQFCTAAFSEYNRLTSIDALFNVGVKYLIFFKWFWAYYQWVLLILGLLVFIYLLVFPSDRKIVERGYAKLGDER
eukprot:TRINITY_DN18393_c0_g1_i1.p1 TRINITY_DN18393_c0_g1~~TRINITY_DN18393_c0_g1_i1.p1  ORF type:complete len:486 (+),score=22.70 TRINITY_DN18393_c0_g1_i1:154-1611(+)